jgi:hypothetical protein
VERPNRPYLSEMGAADLFLVKSDEWAYEKEWRLLRSAKSAAHTIHTPQGDVYLFPISPGCIRRVVFGCRMFSDMKEQIAKLLMKNTRYSHIILEQAAIDEAEFKLNYKSYEIPKGETALLDGFAHTSPFDSLRVRHAG